MTTNPAVEGKLANNMMMATAELRSRKSAFEKKCLIPLLQVLEQSSVAFKETGPARGSSVENAIAPRRQIGRGQPAIEPPSKIRPVRFQYGALPGDAIALVAALSGKSSPALSLASRPLISSIFLS